MSTSSVRKVEKISSHWAECLRFCPRPKASGLATAAALFAILCAIPCRAGGPPLTGTITDALGRPLANSSIELRSADGTVKLQAVTDHAGRFTLNPPRSGLYSLFAIKRGFHSANKVVSYPTRQGAPVIVALGARTALTVPVEASVIRGQNTVSSTGANKYTVTAQDIKNLPRGDNSTITDVLVQMPGVAIDQNQQIHIRNTEGPQFQYQINGVMVPLDINTNPPFISMINPMFVERLSLLDGILPSRYSYATGGVVDIQTKDGCSQPGGSVSVYGGQRDTLQPSFQYGGCDGKFSYYVSGLYSQSNTAFSSATPAPDAIHDYTNQGQGFGFFTWDFNPTTRLSLITSMAASDNQLPNQANLVPEFKLTGVGPYPSEHINSYLNFRDYLGMLSLNGAPAPGLTYQLAYAAHYISQKFEPDDIGELLYQGVASNAFHSDLDNTLQGDLTYQAWPSYPRRRLLPWRIRRRSRRQFAGVQSGRQRRPAGTAICASSRNQQRQQDQSALWHLPSGHLADHRKIPRQCRCSMGSPEWLYLQQSV